MGATLSELLVVADSRFGSGAPATWYPALGLATSVPNPDGSGFVEPSGGGYARPAVANSATNFPAAFIEAGRVLKKNGTAVSWGDPTADWGPVGYVGFFDVLTAGTARWIFRIKGQNNVSAANTIVELPAGDLILPFPAVPINA